MASTLAQQATRVQQDALLSANVALPNAANTVNTNAIQVGGNSAGPFPTNGRFTVQLATSLATGANSLNINVALQHTSRNSDGTADNGNWANIPELAVRTIAGNATKYPATTYNIPLPDGCKEFIRGTARGEANGGNSSDGTITVTLLF